MSVAGPMRRLMIVRRLPRTGDAFSGLETNAEREGEDLITPKTFGTSSVHRNPVIQGGRQPNRRQPKEARKIASFMSKAHQPWGPHSGCRAPPRVFLPRCSFVRCKREGGKTRILKSTGLFPSDEGLKHQ
ncbi:hypothetical protein ACLOJK_041802 [Asimina triloba]